MTDLHNLVAMFERTKTPFEHVDTSVNGWVSRRIHAVLYVDNSPECPDYDEYQSCWCFDSGGMLIGQASWRKGNFSTNARCVFLLTSADVLSAMNESLPGLKALLTKAVMDGPIVGAQAELSLQLMRPTDGVVRSGELETPLSRSPTNEAGSGESGRVGP